VPSRWYHRLVNAQQKETFNFSISAISYFEEKVPLPPFEQYQINAVASWIRKACSYGEDLRRIACAEISATSPLETSQATKVWVEGIKTSPLDYRNVESNSPLRSIVFTRTPSFVLYTAKAARDD